MRALEVKIRGEMRKEVREELDARFDARLDARIDERIDTRLDKRTARIARKAARKEVHRELQERRPLSDDPMLDSEGRSILPDPLPETQTDAIVHVLEAANEALHYKEIARLIGYPEKFRSVSAACSNLSKRGRIMQLGREGLYESLDRCAVRIYGELRGTSQPATTESLVTEKVELTDEQVADRIHAAVARRELAKLDLWATVGRLLEIHPTSVKSIISGESVSKPTMTLARTNLSKLDG